MVLFKIMLYGLEIEFLKSKTNIRREISVLEEKKRNQMALL